MPVSHRQSSHNSESVRPVKDAFFPDALSLASEGRGPCRGVWRTPGWHNVSLENLTSRPTNWACLNAATILANMSYKRWLWPPLRFTLRVHFSRKGVADVKRSGIQTPPRHLIAVGLAGQSLWCLAVRENRGDRFIMSFVYYSRHVVVEAFLPFYQDRIWERLTFICLGLKRNHTIKVHFYKQCR